MKKQQDGEEPKPKDWIAFLFGLSSPDRLAAEIAVHEITRVIRRVLHGWRLNREDRKELCQEILIHIRQSFWQNPPRERDTALRYIKVSAKNKISDFVRKSTRRGETLAEDSDAYPDGTPTDLELKITLQASLDGLPKEQRDVLVLIKIERLSLAEAAERLGVSVPTVKRRTNKAIRFLAAQLDISLDKRSKTRRRNGRKKNNE